MTTSPNRSQTWATVGRVVFLLSLLVGVVLAAVVVWGVLEVRDQETAQGEDVELAGNQGVVAMTEGGERTIYVDGRSLETARCTVTGPDGAVQTLQGYDPVGREARLGKRALGGFEATESGEHQFACTGVEESWVSDELDPQRRSWLAVPAVAGGLLVAGVVPVGLISLIVWRVARRR